MKLSKTMIEALKLACSHNGKYDEHMINRFQLHQNTAKALVERGLIKATSGYGWQFGGIYIVTEKGEQEVKKLM